MSGDSRQQRSKEDEDRLADLVKVAIGSDDEDDVPDALCIQRDSQPLRAAKQFLEDMEEDGFLDGPEEAGNSTALPMGIPEMATRHEQTLLKSVYIGGPEPKFPVRRARPALDPQLEASLASKRSGTDQSVNLMDPSKARSGSSPEKNMKTTLRSKFLGLDASVFTHNNASSSGDETQELIRAHRFNFRRDKKNLLVMFLFVAMMLGIYFGFRSADLGLSSDDSDTQTTARSKQYEQTPFKIENVDPMRIAAFIEKVPSFEASHLKKLAKAGTPQNEALKWMFISDPMKLDPDSDEFLQRYALATLFFGTSGRNPNELKSPKDSKWIRKDNWLTEGGYCEWYGVRCVASDQNDENFLEQGNGVVFQLNLTANVLEGVVPADLALLTGLFQLDLKSNTLGGSIPSELSRCTTMRDLLLEDNVLTSTIPSELWTMPELRILSLAYNGLTGTLSENIGTAKKLHFLSLDDNKINGGLPDSISQLTKLESLYLTTNQFSSTLPESFYSMKRLVNLRLSENNFQGTLSQQLSQLSHLEVVHLVDNKFTGTLPNAFQKMYLLKEMHIQYNAFSGTVPDSLGQLRKLNRLAIEENTFTGSMPASICNLRNTGDLSHLSATCISKATRPQLDSGVPSRASNSGTSTNTVIDLNDLNRRNLQQKAKQVMVGRYSSLAVYCSCCTKCNSALQSSSGTGWARPQTEFPEVVGMKGTVAEKKLQIDNPSMTVVLCGNCSIRDRRKDRIRIFVDANGIVQTPPKVG